MIKETSIALRLGLEKGFVSLEEIEKWADSVLQSDYPYEDWLGDLSTASQNGVPKTYSTLGTVTGEPVPEDMWAAFRDLFSRKIKSGEITAHEALTLLVSQGDALPSQVAADVLKLSKDASASNVEDGVRRLIENA